MDAAASRDPENGLSAVLALRGLVEVLESLQVDHARAQGWSWRDIARRLGVTKQGRAPQARAAVPGPVKRMWDRPSPAAVQVMNLARDEAEQLGQDYIGDEDALLGVLGHGASPAAALMREAGLTASGVRAELARGQRAGHTPRRRAAH